MANTINKTDRMETEIIDRSNKRRASKREKGAKVEYKRVLGNYLPQYNTG